jgi:PAS domain S-box-containing protein
MKLYFERHVFAGFLGAVIVLVFLAWYSFTSLQRLIQTALLLSHTTRVINNAEQLMKSAVDIETSQRGYVITGDEAYLEPSALAKENLPVRIASLDSLTLNHPQQQERIKALSLLVANQLNRFQRITEARGRSFEEARDSVTSGAGKATTDAIRALVANIQEEERIRFRKNNTITAKSLQQFQYSFIGLVITAAGIVLYLVYTVNDTLRSRKKIEKKLLLAAAETRDLYDNAPCGYLSVDANLYLIRINKTLLSWLGYRPQEVISKMKYEDLLAPDSKEKFLKSVKEDFEQYKAEGIVNDLEFDFIRKDGTIFPVIVNSAAVYDNKNEFVSSRTIVFDNSEQKRVQEKFKGLLEAAPDASVIVGEDGIIQMVNNQCEHVFGYARNELVGQPVELLIPNRFKDIHPAHRKNFLDHPTVRPMGVGLDLLGLRKNGAEFPIEISLSPIKTVDGLLISASIRDITERKQTENTIRKLNQELESFTYSVSHDLRAPLRSIGGYSQILKEDYAPTLDAEGQRITEIIIKNARRMGQLIDDLLDFSRMGRKELMRANLNMNDLVHDVLKELALESTPTITINVHPLPPAKADMGMLRQVWINLLSNAIKYSSKKEHIQITIGATENETKNYYYVRDNGAGFDMQYAPKLFGVFQRLHKMDEFEGTGVGLALVKRIIDRHEGEVWAEGVLHEGATFYFSLPKNSTNIS